MNANQVQSLDEGITWNNALFVIHNGAILIPKLVAENAIQLNWVHLAFGDLHQNTHNGSESLVCFPFDIRRPSSTTVSLMVAACRRQEYVERNEEESSSFYL